MRLVWRPSAFALANAPCCTYGRSPLDHAHSNWEIYLSVIYRMRAANGGRSGRLRMPVQETASTQIAAKILADVKSQLSAEYASKAAAAAAHAQTGSPASGTLSSEAYPAIPHQTKNPQVHPLPFLCFVCL